MASLGGSESSNCVARDISTSVRDIFVKLLTKWSLPAVNHVPGAMVEFVDNDTRSAGKVSQGCKQTLDRGLGLKRGVATNHHARLKSYTLFLNSICSLHATEGPGKDNDSK